MLAWALYRWAARNSVTQWAGPLSRGEMLGAFCLTEPDVGSDATGITTTAARSGSGWLLNGTKNGSPTASAPTFTWWFAAGGSIADVPA